jgi:hypothetical protein
VSVRVRNLKEVQNKLMAYGAKMDVATGVAVRQASATIQRQARKNAATGSHKPGEPHIPGTGPGPNRARGTLIRSIEVDVTRIGFGKYVALIGPTVIYGRMVELGSPTWERGEGYPYLVPAYRDMVNSGILSATFRNVLARELRSI